LQEGDLVFFNTRGRGVTHVGIYMGNNKFAHASTARGVVISDLNEEYYRRRYLGAGRPSADFN
jgi:lipoprotein Spr